ncbi:hypothetical protein E2320_007200 [Naja naja]|nr:hypothetical protein E2320_007200 [Naja naja]
MWLPGCDAAAAGGLWQLPLLLLRLGAFCEPEARQTCRRDGADLISIESQSEQELVEKMIRSYSPSDGDFWIGLRREEDPGNSTQCPSLYTWTDGRYITESSPFTSPETPMQEAVANKTFPEAKDPAWSLLYILISSIPALLLRREQREENTKEKDVWSSTKTQNSPSLEIYNVIKTQGEADLAGTRPQTQNSSFRARLGGEDLCGDYDNMAVNNSESGFVTLASTESGFVTNDIYELCHDQVGQSKESAWVENEIYGY